jgi:hypothetical protein
MNKSTRSRLLRIAAMLDRWAASLRKVVREHTPKRARKQT